MQVVGVSKIRFFIALGVMSSCASVSWASPKHDWDAAGRARYAEVDAAQTGRAVSVLVRGNLDSQWTEHFHSFIEADAVASFLRDQHSDGARLNQKPLVQDAEGFELNQAYIAWREDELLIRAGRQRINLDNQRFIGGNAFWQNEQTFDALLAEYLLLGHSRFTYSYIANANRIFGEKADKGDIGRTPALYGDHAQRSHIGHLEWNGFDYSRLATYAYRMDNQDMPSVSNATYGASYAFHYKRSRIKYRLQLEVAEQKRFALMPNQLGYLLWDAGVALDAVELNFRHEVLDADNGHLFTMPLGSGQQFDGWAGVASGLAKAGLRHDAVGVVWRRSPFRTDIFRRQFHEVLTDRNIGHEWNVDVSYRPQRKQRLSLRFAQFEPAGSAQDTRKLFVDYAYNL